MVPSAVVTAPRSLGLALAVLALVAPLAIMPGGWDAANLPQSVAIDVGACAIAAGALWSRSVPAPAFPAWGVSLLTLLVWASLSLAWAIDAYEGAAALLHLTSCALVAWLATGLLRRVEERQVVAHALLLAGTLVAVLGLSQRFLGVDWVPQGIPPSATFVNKNVAAQFVLAVLPFSLALAAGGRRRLAVCAAMLASLYLFVTFTRSAWLALGAQILAAVVLLVPRPMPPVVRRRLALGGASSALILAAFMSLTPPGRSASAHLLAPLRLLQGETQSADSSMSALSVKARLAVWANTLAMVRDHPLTGVGLGQHRLHYPRYARALAVDPHFGERFQLDFVHDDPLQLLAELGLVGLGLALWLLVCAWRAVRAAMLNGAADERVLAVSVGLSALGLGVDSLFSFPLERALPPFVLALGLGLVTARQDERARPPLSRGWAVVPGLLALSLTLLSIAAVRADLHLSRAFTADGAGDPLQAHAESLRAHTLAPWSFEPVFMAASSALALHRSSEALTLLRQVEWRRPYDLATLGNVSTACAGVGDRNCAAEYARRQAELLPDSAALRLHYGVLALRANERAAARAALEQALTLDPNLALAHKALGVSLLDEPQRREQALAHLRRALEIDPALADAARIRGLLSSEGQHP